MGNLSKIFLLGSFIGILMIQSINGQIAEKFILYGHLVDNVSGKPVPFAHVQIADYNFATITDEYGWFRIIANPGEYHFYFSHISYEPTDKIISISSDTTFLVQMLKKTVLMEEVVVRAEKIVNLTPERYSHVSDYEVINNKLLIIGHPSKRLKSYLYLAGLSGT